MVASVPDLPAMRHTSAATAAPSVAVAPLGRAGSPRPVLPPKDVADRPPPVPPHKHDAGPDLASSKSLGWLGRTGDGAGAVPSSDTLTLSGGDTSPTSPMAATAASMDLRGPLPGKGKDGRREPGTPSRRKSLPSASLQKDYTSTLQKVRPHTGSRRRVPQGAGLG
jgi:hypothetical protein